jgi:phosphate:Na+ symporter
VTEPVALAFVLQVAAAAALLIWSVRLVGTGVERAFGHAMRGWFRRSAGGRPVAAGTGLAAAFLLQSSTAVVLLLASFLKSGAIAPVTGLALLLGADLGSALVPQVLMLRPNWITSVLLLSGVVLFLRGRSRRARPVGRTLIGLGLVFVSLDLIGEASAALPLALSGGIGDYLARDLATAFAIGAALALGMHSSVAAVLLVATLAGAGAMGGSAPFAMVLGANLGGAVLALLVTHASGIEVRRVVAANLLARGGAALLALWALGAGLFPPGLIGATVPAQIVSGHVAFNAAVLVAALPLVGPLLHLARVVLPEPAPSPNLAVSALDPDAIADPPRALACARREILRMGEEIEAMLRTVLPLYETWDEQAAEEIRLREARVDGMHFHTKLYLSRLIGACADRTAAEPAADLVTLAAQIEAAGDEISSTMLGMAQRVHRESRRFSPQGWAELRDFHDRVSSNLQLALQVIMTPEPDTARALIEEKDALRAVEERLQLSHLSRLQEGLIESVETSNIHQETLRALKAVNAAFAAAAHPTLRQAGEIGTTRLTRPAA